MRAKRPELTEADLARVNIRAKDGEGEPVWVTAANATDDQFAAYARRKMGYQTPHGGTWPMARRLALLRTIDATNPESLAIGTILPKQARP